MRFLETTFRIFPLQKLTLPVADCCLTCWPCNYPSQLFSFDLFQGNNVFSSNLEKKICIIFRISLSIFLKRIWTACGKQPVKYVLIKAALGIYQASQVSQWEKNLPANAGHAGDSASILGWRRSSGGGNGNPLQYSCLENFMDRRLWWAEVSVITKIWTPLSVHTVSWYLSVYKYKFKHTWLDSSLCCSNSGFLRPVFQIPRAFTFL